MDPFQEPASPNWRDWRIRVQLAIAAVFGVALIAAAIWALTS